MHMRYLIPRGSNKGTSLVDISLVNKSVIYIFFITYRQCEICTAELYTCLGLTPLEVSPSTFGSHLGHVDCHHLVNESIIWNPQFLWPKKFVTTNLMSWLIFQLLFFSASRENDWLEGISTPCQSLTFCTRLSPGESVLMRLTLRETSLDASEQNSSINDQMDQY